VAPRPLVQVALEPLVRHGVMSATDASFEQAEEAVDGLRVYVAVNVDLGVMLDPAVGVAGLAEPFVALPFVGEDHGAGKDELAHLGVQNRAATIRHDLGADTAAPLDRTKDDCLAVPVVGLCVPALRGTSPAIRLTRLPAHERL